MKGLTLNQKEQARLQVLNEVLEGGVRVREAALVLGLILPGKDMHGEYWQLIGGKELSP